jgi:hypothetical protein
MIPLVIAVTLGLFLLPRSTPPDLVPLPQPDESALAAAERADDALADAAEREGLPGDLRELGSRIRDYHTLEERAASGEEMMAARSALEKSLGDALAGGSFDALRRLRAVETRQFLEAARTFEATGRETDDLSALAGSFVRRMRLEGWCVGHQLAMRPRELRVMYKMVWNGTLLLESKPELALSLDEQRVLYAFYLAHPHVLDGTRQALEASRRRAADKGACLAAEAAERISADRWRLDHVKRLASIDPEYPADYARGALYFRIGSYGQAAESFRDWLRDHPSGPWSLRARYNLRASVEADLGQGPR